MKNFTGRRVVITGGSRGIGNATAELFLETGASVLTCGRSSARPDGLSHDIEWLSADVSKQSGIDLLHAAAGKTDILINNAGVQVEKTIVDSTDEDWDAVMGTNARGVFFACRTFIPSMKTNGGGVIINIGSISGHVADPGMALYNASKAFVHGLTRSIAVDHGSDGIRCNAICPGWVMTGMADAAFDMAQDAGAAEQDALARHPAGRFGRPDDIARTAAWLASDDAVFVTGQTVTVDGGLTAASPLQPRLF